MLDESLAYKVSAVHRLEPRARIIASMFLSFGTALSHRFDILGLYFIVSAALVFTASLSWHEVWGRLKPLLWFVVMIWIFLPLSFEGEIIWQYGWVKVSFAGVRLCMEITLKSVTILLVFTALVATMTVATIGYGLHRLNFPEKLTFLLLMTYRYIYVIRDEYHRLLRAARFRGFVPKTNLHSYRTFAYLAGMLFVRASFRAQRVYRAMVCRGFRGRFRTLDVYRLNGIDYLFIILCTLCAGILLLFEYYRIFL
ncbi:MAG: cobalt ECF transporter T component CbiQ [Desulfobacteraceae bacterium]|nr:MAG: cobalt ECF transporter T component CbiQ [Desulfobacteraceae bacterium]